MAKKKGILAGKKINQKHSTYNEVAGLVIKCLKKHDNVSKIVLGPIAPARAISQRRVTVREDQGQCKLLCRDSASIQTLWVIGEDKEVLEKLLKGIFS